MGRTAKDPNKAGTTTLKGVNRALEVLSYLAIHPGRVVDIVERLGASWATLHRTLSQLESRQFIKRDPATGEFSIGPRMWLIGATYVADHPILELARPYIDEIAESSPFTVQLAERMDRLALALYSRHRSGEDITKATYGYHFPLHCGSKGLALLAFGGDALLEQYLQEPLEKLTPRTLAEPQQVREAVAKIREDGFALTVGDVQNFTGSLAAPIFDRGGQAVASLCFIARKSFFENEGKIDEAVERLLRTSQAISLAIGWKPGRLGDRAASA